MFMSFNTVDFIAFFTFSVTDVFNVTTELTKLIETYIHTYIYLNLTARSRTQRYDRWTNKYRKNIAQKNTKTKNRISANTTS